MSKRFGNAREPGCQCDYSYTCRVCLAEAGHRAHAAQFGVFQPPAQPPAPRA